MTVTYNRKLKVYESDIVDGAWPTRLDAEAAELPQRLLDKALNISDSLAVAIGAVHLVLDGVVKSFGNGDYSVPSKSQPGLTHYISLTDGGCDCDAFLHGQTCRHWVAALLIESGNGAKPAPRKQRIEAIPPKPACKALIEELYGDW